MESVVIGTAGWAVPREHAAAAPVEGSGLQRYASVLSVTEINSTFQRRHRPTTFERWRDSVPESFRFSVKLPRAITHDTALAAPRAALREFFADVAGLGNKLGPILVQLPASSAYDPRRARTFFRELRALYSGPCACEPRHPSWYDDRVNELFVEYEVARVIADPPRPEAARFPGGTKQLRYVRWHGSPNVYRSSYEDERLQRLVDLIVTQASGSCTWCIFDNTASGAAFGNALRLRQLLQQTPVAVLRPVRLQRSRAKGARLSAPNDLPIVCVSRPSKWGNPFAIEAGLGDETEKAKQRARAVSKFRQALLERARALPFTSDDVRRELRAKNLACWCPLGGPCHADVLLEVANA